MLFLCLIALLAIPSFLIFSLCRSLSIAWWSSTPVLCNLTALQYGCSTWLSPWHRAVLLVFLPAVGQNALSESWACFGMAGRVTCMWVLLNPAGSST